MQTRVISNWNRQRSNPQPSKWWPHGTYTRGSGCIAAGIARIWQRRQGSLLITARPSARTPLNLVGSRCGFHWRPRCHHLIASAITPLHPPATVGPLLQRHPPARRECRQSPSSHVPPRQTQGLGRNHLVMLGGFIRSQYAKSKLVYLLTQLTVPKPPRLQVVNMGRFASDIAFRVKAVSAKIANACRAC